MATRLSAPQDSVTVSPSWIAVMPAGRAAAMRVPLTSTATRVLVVIYAPAGLAAGEADRARRLTTERTNALLVPRLVSCSFFAMLSFMNAWLSGM